MTRTSSWTLDIANPDMMDDLRAVAVRAPDDPAFPFRLISRRMPHVYNSSTPAIPANRPRHNPVYIHPDDLTRLGATPGTVVRIRSPRGAVSAVVEADDSMRPGTISMSHSWGDVPGSAESPVPGSCTASLVDIDAVYDRFTGQPRMSDVPVAVDTVPGT